MPYRLFDSERLSTGTKRLSRRLKRKVSFVIAQEGLQIGTKVEEVAMYAALQDAVLRVARPSAQMPLEVTTDIESLAGLHADIAHATTWSKWAHRTKHNFVEHFGIPGSSLNRDSIEALQTIQDEIEIKDPQKLFATVLATFSAIENNLANIRFENNDHLAKLGVFHAALGESCAVADVFSVNPSEDRLLEWHYLTTVLIAMLEVLGGNEQSAGQDLERALIRLREIQAKALDVLWLMEKMRSIYLENPDMDFLPLWIDAMCAAHERLNRRLTRLAHVEKRQLRPSVREHLLSAQTAMAN